MIRVLHLFSRETTFQTEHGISLLTDPTRSAFQTFTLTIGRGCNFRSALGAGATLRFSHSGFDLIHAWDPAAFIAAVASGLPVIFSPGEPVKRGSWSWLATAAYSDVHVVSATRWACQRQIQAGLDAERCHVIMPGLESLAVSPQAGADLRSRLGISPSQFVILAPGESARDVAVRAAAALETHLARHHASIAAFIVEPLVQGATGMAMHDPHYLERARELCTRFEVLLIADEIMTGFGRTGTMFACEAAGIAPDMICLSKGLTGGYLPLSCVLSTDDVFAAFYADDTSRGFLHSHSYTGNALACRAALAVLDIFHTEDVLAANLVKAARWTALAAALEAHPKVRRFRHRGMIWAFEVDTHRADFARWCFTQGLARELLLRPIGRTVYFMPPYILTDDEFALLAARTVEIVDAA